MELSDFTSIASEPAFCPMLVMPNDPRIFLSYSPYAHFSKKLKLGYADISYSIVTSPVESMASKTMGRVDFGSVVRIHSDHRVADTAYFSPYILQFNSIVRLVVCEFDPFVDDGPDLFNRIVRDIDFSRPVREYNVLNGRESSANPGLFSQSSIKEVLAIQDDLDLEVKLVTPYRSILIFKNINIGGISSKRVDCAVVCVKFSGGVSTWVLRLLDYPNSILVQPAYTNISEHWHPHVGRGGHPCFGVRSNEQEFNRMIWRDRNLLSVALYMKGFLETYNRDGSMCDPDVFR